MDKFRNLLTSSSQPFSLDSVNVFVPNHKDMKSTETNLDSDKLKPLLEERKSLLQDINDARLSQPSASGSKEHLNQCILRYEELMDQIEVLNFERSPLSDPLKIFPAEIWQDILRLASHDSRHLGLSTIDNILIFTLVSDLWRQKILSSPTLWTELRLDGSGEDHEAKLATAFHLCADLPLHLELILSQNILDMICPYIVGQGHRIRTLNISYFLEVSHHTRSELLARLVGEIGSLTRLENFSFSDSMRQVTDTHAILKDAAQIKSLNYLSMPLELLQLDSMQYLRQLTTKISLDEIIPHLSRLSHLTSITAYIRPSFLIKNLLSEASAGAGSDKGVKEATPNLGIISCKVTSITISYPQRSFGRLLRRTAKCLTHLAIPISWGDLLAFITVSQDLVKLERLELTFLTQNNRNKDLNLDPALSDIQIPKINVKNLHLNIWVQSYYATLKEVSDICHENAKRLVGLITTWIPDVAHLNVQTTFNDAFLISYFRSLRYLRYLSIAATDQVLDISASNTGNTLMALPLVETLSILGRSSVLGSFSYPNSHRLYLHESQQLDSLGFRRDPEYESLTTLVDPKTGMLSDNWISLTYLDIADQNVDWNGISLPAVSTITIGFEQGRDSTSRLSSSSLLVELASKRGAFPSLQKLRMRCIPEWDLLFIMLERRNFSICDRNHQKSISLIGLPFLPPPFILRPLVGRLGRRLTKRPSNFDLSLQSLVKIYFDFTIVGCHFCHLSYLPCDALNFAHQADYKTLEILPYPYTSEEVLASSSKRAEWWAGVMRLARGRTIVVENTIVIV